MIHLALVDHLLIGLYFLAVVVIGLRASRNRGTGDAVDFLLAGRSLTLPVFVMTLVSTWYGGILGVGEFSYRYGISNWALQGAPYYVFAAVFALLLAPRVRAVRARDHPRQACTIPTAGRPRSWEPCSRSCS